MSKGVAVVMNDIREKPSVQRGCAGYERYSREAKSEKVVYYRISSNVPAIIIVVVVWRRRGQPKEKKVRQKHLRLCSIIISRNTYRAVSKGKKKKDLQVYIEKIQSNKPSEIVRVHSQKLPLSFPLPLIRSFIHSSKQFTLQKSRN